MKTIVDGEKLYILAEAGMLPWGDGSTDSVPPLFAVMLRRKMKELGYSQIKMNVVRPKSGTGWRFDGTVYFVKDADPNESRWSERFQSFFTFSFKREHNKNELFVSCTLGNLVLEIVDESTEEGRKKQESLKVDSIVRTEGNFSDIIPIVERTVAYWKNYYGE